MSSEQSPASGTEASQPEGAPDPVEQLERLRSMLAHCMLADAGRLRTRIQRLLKRARRGQPVDRGMGEVIEAISQSSALRKRRAQARPHIVFPQELPVSRRRQDIEHALAEHQVVVVCGETGSGKSTQLPKLCLAAGRGVAGTIGHTQPRRLAARSLAKRIGEETNPKVVGYKVRFTDETSPSSLIKLMTDGVLLNELRSDPQLLAYDTLIIDEAHERSLNIDFLLGYLKRLLPQRPDLKVIVTSATIDPERFSQHFDDAPVVEVSGRGYPVRVTYLEPSPEEDEEEEGNAQAPRGEGKGRPKRNAAERPDGEGTALLQGLELVAADPDGRKGDVLVFLPGERQIREAALLLSRHLPKRPVLPLYARLSAAEQDKVFSGAGNGRIVLATNVAETSLTVPGITAVIDSGLARISRYSHRAKIQRLPIERVAQASAEQRKGRCGRIGPGFCVRLYTEADFGKRRQFTEPEIARTNLASVILRMALLGLGDIEQFPFVEPPERRLINDGYRLLQILQAMDEDRNITELGRRMAEIPVDPRLARVLLAGADHDSLAELLIICSGLAIADPRERPAEKARSADIQHAKFAVDGSDFLTFLKIWEAYQVRLRSDGRKAVRRWCKKRFLNAARMQEWEELHRQLADVLTAMAGVSVNEMPATPRRIHIPLLRGFIDMIGQRVEKHTYQGARSLQFRIFPGSGLHGGAPRWIMAAAIIDTSRPYAMTVARIRRGWMESAGEHLLKRSYFDAHWNEVKGRVDAYEQATLFGLLVYTKRRVAYTDLAPDESRAIFIQDALLRDKVETEGEFSARNKALRDELEGLENKLRSRDILASEGQLFAFYDERVPAGIASNRAFERWRREVESESPGLLVMAEGDARRPGAREASTQDYPDTLVLDGNELPISYRFDREDPADGATLTLPVALLGHLTQGILDRLVPAWLEPLLVQLLRALPKATRKRLPPAPDTARWLRDDVVADMRPVPEAFAAAIEKQYEVAVDQSAWDRKQLEPWCLARALVIDEQGRVLGASRSVCDLQARFAHLAERVSSGHDFSREGLSTFDIDELPESMRLQQGPVEVTAYPALVDRGKTVALELLAEKGQAKRATRDGLVRLFMLALPQQVQLLRKDFTRDQRRILMAQGLGALEAMSSDLAFVVFRDAFTFALRAPIRTREAFEAALERGRAQVLALAERRQAMMSRVLERYSAVRSRLAQAHPAAAEAVNDVRNQLEVLLAPGFVRHTPEPWLGEIPRYLEAMRIRLEKLAQAPTRDDEPRELVREYWLRYLRVAPSQAQSLASKPELTLFRWQVEELRVSLFAQPLGTRVPVSPKRLDKQWAKVQAEQQRSS
ncbi:MAG: ATP-dependent RNA helicase HrpA [Pseudomonadota bacterium]